MIEIKGSIVSDSIKSVQSHFGDQMYNDIVDQLNGRAREIFHQPSILSSSWYPLDAYVEFLITDIKVTAQGKEEELIKRAEALIEQQLTGIYKFFVRLGSPQFVLNRLSVIHQTYFRGVDAAVCMKGSSQAVIKYTGFTKQHRIIGFTIIGFYRKALEISGAKDVHASFSTPIEDGKTYCELNLSWAGK